MTISFQLIWDTFLAFPSIFGLP